jgi:hypothetical protein
LAHLGDHRHVLYHDRIVGEEGAVENGAQLAPVRRGEDALGRRPHPVAPTVARVATRPHTQTHARTRTRTHARVATRPISPKGQATLHTLFAPIQFLRAASHVAVTQQSRGSHAAVVTATTAYSLYLRLSPQRIYVPHSSLYVPQYLYLYLSIVLSIYPNIYIYIYLSFYLSIYIDMYVPHSSHVILCTAVCPLCTPIQSPRPRPIIRVQARAAPPRPPPARRTSERRWAAGR